MAAELVRVAQQTPPFWAPVGGSLMPASCVSPLCRDGMGRRLAAIEVRSANRDMIDGSAAKGSP